MAKTVYVATLSPDGRSSSVGALEWRETDAQGREAAAHLSTIKDPGDTEGYHVVEVPDDVVAEGRDAVTDWLCSVVDY